MSTVKYPRRKPRRTSERSRLHSLTVLVDVAEALSDSLPQNVLQHQQHRCLRRRIFPNIEEYMHGWYTRSSFSYSHCCTWPALIASLHTLLRLLPSSRHTAIAVFFVEPLQDGGVRSHNAEITNQVVRAGRFLSRLRLSQCHYHSANSSSFMVGTSARWRVVRVDMVEVGGVTLRLVRIKECAERSRTGFELASFAPAGQPKYRSILCVWHV